MRKVTDEERERIVSMLEEGVSLSQVARETKRGKATISRIAAAAGIVPERSATEKATQAHRDYAKSERLQLLNEGFDKARELLARIHEPRDLQAWTVAMGTLVDKRRLEDGEATERKEQVDPSRREKIKHSLNELAEARKKRLG